MGGISLLVAAVSSPLQSKTMAQLLPLPVYAVRLSHFALVEWSYCITPLLYLKSSCHGFFSIHGLLSIANLHITWPAKIILSRHKFLLLHAALFPILYSMPDIFKFIPVSAKFMF